MCQVLDALQCLHDHGIIHRDLKPGNIFVQHASENAYDIKLIDLGIAHDAAEVANDLKTQTGAVMGTPGYMAVEQYSDAGNVTAAADVYAAAIITWEMLAGAGMLPWGLYDPRVLFHLQMTQAPVPPPDQNWPPELVGLLQRCLAIRPSDRLESARAFAFAFAALVPEIPPNVPSGAQILAQVAPDLVRAPGSDPFGQRASGSLPYRGTSVPASRNDAGSVPMGTPVAALSLNPSSHVTMAPAKGRSAKIAILGVLVAGVTGAAVFMALRAGNHATQAPGDAAVSTPTATAPPPASLDAAVAAPTPPPTPVPAAPTPAQPAPPQPVPPQPVPPQPAPSPAPAPTATGSATVHRDHPARPRPTPSHDPKPTHAPTPGHGSNTQFDPDAAE
jgi:serine/threonine-protein kinase